MHVPRNDNGYTSKEKSLIPQNMQNKTKVKKKKKNKEIEQQSENQSCNVFRYWNSQAQIVSVVYSVFLKKLLLKVSKM